MDLNTDPSASHDWVARGRVATGLTDEFVWSLAFDPADGGGNTLLFAVGAAVIGGTSLFGGRGRLSNAVIGGAVLATVNNGLGLLGQPASVVFLVNGIVLLLAAGVDVLSRRRSALAGR